MNKLRTWGDIEDRAMRCPVACRMVDMERSGLEREEILTQVVMWLLEEMDGWREREVERLKREPGPGAWVAR